MDRGIGIEPLNEVAIVGMSCRFPGIRHTTEFWEKLKDGVELISTFTREELAAYGIEDHLLSDPNFVGASGMLDRMEWFDADFFGYTPREAELIDPGHRLFLECAWEALENAGENPETYRGRIGVYAGAGMLSDYLLQISRDRQLFESRWYTILIGNDKDHLATRAAYKLNLRGPALTVQTACSTSLVAVHLACQSLLNGECDTALAGGVSLRLKPGYLYQEGGILSPDGHCRAFDADSKGTVPGSGVGIVALKRLADAIEDGSTIYAVIKGSAINNDGSFKVGYTAPGMEGQAEVIAEAMAVAGVKADSIGYVEAHGTATQLGDPVEVAALTRVFRSQTQEKSFCSIGSIKTNLGHMDSAAGVAGLIKTALMLHHRMIPPSLHYHAPNPELNLLDSPFVVNAKLREWPSNGAPARAGVSSFGIGGTNAHVVLEQAPAPGLAGKSLRPQLIALSAKTGPALEEMTSNLLDHLKSSNEINLADVAHTLQVGRKSFPHRRMLVCSDSSDAIRILELRDRRRLLTAELQAGHRPVAFMFPGQGAQYQQMGRELYEREPEFREWVDRCAELLEPFAGFDVRNVLYPERADCEEAARLNETVVAQPTLFVVEYCLARMWMSLGVHPEAMIGHSLGEYVAACLAGVLSLEDALKVVAIRGRLMQQLPAGVMLAASLGEEQLEPMLGKALSIAAINGPSRCVVSGPEIAVKDLERRLDGEGIGHRRLNTSVPFHSWMVESILKPFREFLTGVKLNPPERPYISNVSGTWITRTEATDQDYWVRHMRETVHFAGGLTELLSEPNRILLEVGPGQSLSSFALRHPARSSRQIAVASLSQGSTSEQHSLLTGLGKLWLEGVPIDWTALHADEQRHRIPLPTYPFQRDRHWFEGVSSAPTIKENASMNVSKSAPATRSDRQVGIASSLKELFAYLMGVPPAEIPDHVSFLEMGADSLMLLQAGQEIKNRLSVKVPFRMMMDDISTIDLLAAYIDAKLPAPEPEPEPVQSSSAPALGDSRELLKKSSDVAGWKASAQQVLVASPERPAGGVFEDARQTLRVNSDVGSIVSEQLSILTEHVNIMSRQLEMLRATGMTFEKSAAVFSNLQSDLLPQKADAAYRNGSGGASSSNGHSNPIPSGAVVGTTSKAGLSQRQRAHLDDLIARFTARTKESKRLAASYRPILADDRASAGFHRLCKEMQYPLIARHASGSRLWDIDDNEYVDITMGFGALLFGHTPSFLLEALREQTDHGMQLGWESVMSRKAAELLCELTGVERVAFCNSGTEAVMSAIRLARTITGRHKIALFDGSYHGTFDQVLVRGRRRQDGEYDAMPIAPGIPQNMIEDVLLLNRNDPRSMDVLEAHADQLAAVVVEPLQRTSPDQEPRAFLQRLRRITERSDSSLIFDEVLSGFRFHAGGAQAIFDIQADLVTYGKSMSGGLPVAAVTGKALYMDAIDGGQWSYGDSSIPEAEMTFFAGTFFKHPLLMSSVCATLQHIKDTGPKLQEGVNRLTRRLVESLNEGFSRDRVPISVAHFGSFFRFLLPPELKPAELFYFHLLDKGIYICETRNCFLSTAHTDKDVDYLIDGVKEITSELRQGDFFPELPPIPSNGASSNGARKHASSNGGNHSSAATAGAAVKPAQSASSPVTEAQRQVWILTQMGDEASGSCNECFTITFRGSFNLPAMRRAIEKLVARHDALRTTISADGSFQHIHPSMKVDLEIVEFSKIDKSGSETALADWLAREARLPFDPTRGPLMRAKVVRIAEEHHVLILTFNHLITDGRSNGILLGDLGALYSAEAQGKECRLPAVSQAAPHSHEQDEQESDADLAADEDYWLSQFADVNPIIDLPYDRPRQSGQSFRVARESLLIGSSLTRDLRKFSAQHGCTLFMTMLAGFSLLIHRLSASSDAIVSINIATEPSADDSDGVGYGINPLAIRSRVLGDPGFTDYLGSIKRQVLDAYDHQGYSASRLIKKLNLRQRHSDRLSFSSVVFNLDKALTDLSFADLDIDVNTIPTGSKVDMEWNVLDNRNELLLDCDYNPDLFDAGTIRQWIDDYKALLETLIANPQPPLSTWLGGAPTTAVSEEHPRVLEEEAKSLYDRSNLTQCQFLIWMGKMLNPEAPVFQNESNAGLTIFPTPIDLRCLKEACQTLVNSSDAMRTVIEEVDGVPQQRVIENLPYEIPHLDFSSLTDPHQEVRNWAHRRSGMQFDFTRCMFDMALIKLTDNESALYANMHHLIADARSAELMIQYLSDFYSQALKGELKAVVPLPRFSDYVEYERKARGSASYRKAEAYWKSKVEREAEPINFYGKAQTEESTRVERVCFRIDAERGHRLQTVAAGIDGGSNIAMSSVFAALLCSFIHQISRAREISLGVPFHNRRRKPFNETIGLFTHVLPLRIRIDQGETFVSLIKKITDENIKALRYSEYLISNPSRRKAYDIEFNYVVVAPPTFEGVRPVYEWIHTGHGSERLAFQIQNLGSPADILVNFDLNCAAFGEPQREQVQQHFSQVLDAFLQDPGTAVDRLDLLWLEDRRRRISSLEQETSFDFES